MVTWACSTTIWQREHWHQVAGMQLLFRDRVHQMWLGKDEGNAAITSTLNLTCLIHDCLELSSFINVRLVGMMHATNLR